MLKKTLSILFLSIFYFSSIAQCVPINSYTPDSPWIINPEGVRVLKVDPDGSTRVRHQDQTTPPVILALSRYVSDTTLLSSVAKDDFSIEVTSTTGFIDGRLIFIADEALNEIMFCSQIGAPVGNVINIDRPIDFAFAAGSQVEVKDINLNVNGSVATPFVFGLKPDTIQGDIAVDVTRIMFGMTTVGVVDLSMFGDIAGGLTRGITIRRNNSYQSNILNIKTNGVLATFTYDMDIYSESNPVQGQNGLVARFTFSKLGVVVRVGSDDDLEVVIVDDLSSLQRFVIVAEGSLVIP